MPHPHDFGCPGHPPGRCPCGARLHGLGERYVPQILDETEEQEPEDSSTDGFGAAAVRPGPTTAGRLRARVAQVKGKLAERLMSRTPAAHAALAEARMRALREGIDPRTVKFTRDVRGVHHDGVDRQLSDGLIYGRTKSGKVRILNVFESKARSSVRDVAVRQGGDLGQIARDFERLKELPLRIDGQYVQPDNVLVSRQATAWTVFAPRGVRPTPGELHEVRARSGFDLRTSELPLTNDQLAARAVNYVRKTGLPRPRR